MEFLIQTTDMIIRDYVPFFGSVVGLDLFEISFEGKKW